MGPVAFLISRADGGISSALPGPVGARFDRVVGLGGALGAPGLSVPFGLQGPGTFGSHPEFDDGPGAGSWIGGGPGSAGGSSPNGPGSDALPRPPVGPGGSFARARCSDCNFNASALVSFTQDFTLVNVEGSLLDATTTTLRGAANNRMEANGTIALDLRRMQAQLTLRESECDNPDRRLDWEILVNGATRKAALRISSSTLSACMSANLQTVHAPQDQQLLSIENMSSTTIRRSGRHGNWDGADVVVLSQDMPPWETLDAHDGFAIGLNNQKSTLALLRFPWSPRIEGASQRVSGHTQSQFGIKFSNYRASTDFADAGCSAAGHAAAQELLAEPEVRAHLERRLRQFEQHAAVALRSVPFVAYLFAAVPTELVDLFLPEKSARGDMDMLQRVHSTGGVHTAALSLLLLCLIVVGGGLMLRRALSDEPDVDSYEDSTP